MIRDNIRISKWFLALIAPLYIVILVLIPSLVSAQVAPGCYKIQDGKPSKLESCPVNAVYDDGKGGNLAKPSTEKCYVYSKNLYDGDTSFGDPYVQVDCTALASCPANQELRYSPDKFGPPSCVEVSKPPGGDYVPDPNPNSTPAPAATDKTCDGSTPDTLKTCYEGNPLVKKFDDLINFLAVGVGVVVVIMVIIGGIQYTTAGSNPQAVAAARKKILNAVISLVAFILLYSFMQWLIPGGIF